MRTLLLIALILGSVGCGKEPTPQEASLYLEPGKYCAGQVVELYHMDCAPRLYGSYCVVETDTGYLVSGKPVAADDCSFRGVDAAFRRARRN